MPEQPLDDKPRHLKCPVADNH